jgi:hypothetical protein
MWTWLRTEYLMTNRLQFLMRQCVVVFAMCTVVIANGLGLDVFELFARIPKLRIEGGVP